MEDKLQRQVLVLNKNWQAVNVVVAQEAFVRMAADAATALNCDDDKLIPVKWTDWIKLPIGPGDGFVGTGRGPVRIPIAVVALRFSKMPIRQQSLNLHSLWEREGGRCAYTGRELTPEESSMDHIIPASAGGKRVWENVVLCDKRINSIKGSKTLKQAGLKLRVTPRAPRALPACEIIKRRFFRPEWIAFLGEKAA